MTVFDPNNDPVAMLIALLEQQANELASGNQTDSANQLTDDHVRTAALDETCDLYDIELDDSEQTLEALEARGRILDALADLTPPEDQGDDETHWSPDEVDAAFGAIIAATPWEDIDAELVVARGSHSLPTRDLTCPELSDFGYLPEVEVEIDLDQSQGLATVTLLLEADEDAEPRKLKVVVCSPDGFSRSAVVSEFGVAKLAEIPIEKLRSLELRWAPKTV